VNEAIPIIPAPSTSEPAVAARNRGCARSSGSSSGAATRRSTSPNAVRARSANTPSTTVGTSTPFLPCVSAETARVMPATSRTNPAMSTRRFTTAEDSATHRRVGGTRRSAATAVTQ
jgi:hypothetical protein